MSYQTTDLVNVGQLKSLATRTKAGLDTAIKYASVSGNTISLFKTADGSGVADFTIDFPQEMFLDQTKTEFVPSFTFSATTYPGATNPNLDGKPVMVLAVKATDGTTATTAYSFLNMATLVDTYTVKSGDSTKVLAISGYQVEFKVSSTTGNIIQASNNGLYATNRVSGATQNDLVAFDSNGAPVDSGILKTNVLQTSNIATDSEVTEMMAEVFGD